MKVIIPKAKSIEQRIFWIGAGLVAAASLFVGATFGLRSAASFFSGAALGIFNLLWLRQSVNALAFDNPKRAKRFALAGFFLRLLLIPLTLYAMLRFLFVSIPAAVAGFAVFNCSIFVEGILEAFETRSK
jgi:hypothetical protein